MKKQHTFLSRLQRIASLALASSAGVTALACSDDGSSATSTSSSSSSSTSSSGSVANLDGGGSFADDSAYACTEPLGDLVAGLSPATPVDYLELRRQAWTGDGGGAKRTASKKGTPCATATNKAACETALDALAAPSPPDGWYTNGDPVGAPLTGAVELEILVYTRGDEVKALRTLDEVKAFLGTIDTLEDARMLLVPTNVHLACTTTPAKSGWKQNADGSFELLVAGVGCGSFIKYRWHYAIGKDGSVVGPDKDPQFESGGVCGRRPDGLATLASGASVGLAAYFAEVAHLEAASVVAFRRLEQDLRALDAPEELVTRARRSRSDEIRHARETAALARRFGAVVPPVVVDEPGPRDAFAVALENAVEGCVRETYGAAVALFQAERATAELRPLLLRIAKDEARHAELAHDVASWLERRLDANERAELAKAKAAAFAELAFALASEPAADVQRIAGMPTAREAALLLAALAQDLAA